MAVFDTTAAPEKVGIDVAAEIYSGREYFVKNDAYTGTDGYGYSGSYLSQQALIEDKFDRILGHLERYVTPGRLLDVGCGPGFLLTVAQRRGWSATGIDLNAWAVDHARDVLGVEAVCGTLDDATFEPESFDAVTMMDFIEHVPSADDVLARAKQLLRPGGILAVLTPRSDAALSRLLGRRWPEIVPGEHATLFSLKGLTTALSRHGLAAGSYHSVGKKAPLSVLIGDASPALPRVAGATLQSVARGALGEAVVDIDPHTKVCVYARRLPDGRTPPRHRPARIPKEPQKLAGVDQAIVEELSRMAASSRLMGAMFSNFAPYVAGAKVFEVGAGIGTFTRMMLGTGAEAVLAMEPEPACARVLEGAFADEPRVEVTREALPDAPILSGRQGSFDLVVCNNVLEHIADDARALEVMGSTLKPGGMLSLLVPAHPRLYGSLDDAYGHWRRYERAELGDLLVGAGFSVRSIRAQNCLGVLGWWAKNLRPGARVGPASYAAYEALMALWRPFESRATKAGIGLSWVVEASRSSSETEG
jgi:2-polyprenyl-3-methyl-5-hydroxy-6-metoxy-1,4-benzoquinol methylase